MPILQPIKRWISLCAVMLCGLLHTPAQAEPLSLDQIERSQSLGEYTSYFKETGPQLPLHEVISARQQGKFIPSATPILAFGIASPPVWIHLPVKNTGEPLLQRLLIENSWQDQIDIHFVAPNGTRSTEQLGDTRRFAERPVKSRFFAANHRFDHGITDIYLRVQSADPIVLPIFLANPETIAEREQGQGYGYGFLYGYLIALMGYNFLLYLGLRDKRQLSYAAYIGLFLAANFAYTGHGYASLWGNQVVVQSWIIPILMVAYALSGLVFASLFLDTKNFFPRTHKVMFWSGWLFPLALLASFILSSNQASAILIAFTFVILFSLTMPILGAMALHTSHRLSRYFLFATLASALGSFTTAATVLGFIPYSDLRFRAVEIGMLIDATLLALALGSQFRTIQTERQAAQRLAARDPLTDLYNRRSFLEMARPLWSNAKRHERKLSLIMLDIDHFKSINDQHGHATGDRALKALARVLNETLREGDLAVRWGGEEFLLLLPETGLEAAVQLAERLREAVATIKLKNDAADPGFTASFGVACCSTQESLDRLISEADHFLYQAKHMGRNRVCSLRDSTEI